MLTDHSFEACFHFFDWAIAYDRVSNVTLIEDNVYAGWDTEYAMDGLDRLVDATSGTWSGSAITSQTRREVWELDHAGNWDVNKLDLNGDNDYADAGEFNLAGAFDDSNAQTGRGANSFLPDDVGNFADNGDDQKLVYDVFRRLRKVTDPSDKLIAQFRYNGLGQCIAAQFDSDGDTTVETADSNDDDWRYLVYTPNWQGLAAERRLLRHIIGALAELEREMIATRIAETRAYLRRHGRRLAGPAPFSAVRRVCNSSDRSGAGRARTSWALPSPTRQCRTPAEPGPPAPPGHPGRPARRVLS